MSKGASVLVAALCLLSLAIGLALSVGLWVLGVWSDVSRVEIVEFKSAYSMWYDDYVSIGDFLGNNTWIIYLVVENKGSVDVTITDVVINDKPIGAVKGVKEGFYFVSAKEGWVTFPYEGYPLLSGEKTSIAVVVPGPDFNCTGKNPTGFNHDQIVRVGVKTKGGRICFATLKLP